MKTESGRFLAKLPLCCALLAGFAAPAHAQMVKLQQTFEGATATGWTLTGSAVLTAAPPAIDAVGSGWLRLTAAQNGEVGEALNSAFSFSGNQPVIVQFNYVSWGGTGGLGADGITMFLYDASQSNPMNGAASGGGLGYCGGAGGYLGIGLDEYGNFSNPGDNCGTSSGGPGFAAESLVIRGPLSANNYYVTGAAVPGGIDNLSATTRPSPHTVLLSLTPATGGGYTVTAQFRSGAGQPFVTLFSNVPFPYTAPQNLSVGFSGGTGGLNNNHEIQQLIAGTPDDLQVTMAGPASVIQGSPVTYTVTVTNSGAYPITGTDAPTVTDVLPSPITGTSWTCTGANGATCAATGSGNINTTTLTLPVNGSVTYTVTGTVGSSAACGSTLTNSANADFGSASNFLDPDETNNTASVASQVTCNTTLVANPTALTYPPQQVNTASTSQSVILTGVNTATINSIAVSGDYSQTNNCPASLAATQTCTVNVTFTPTALGSRTGNLTIISTAAASPAVTTVVPLSGTGVNTAPNAFSFTPLVNVDPSSLQVSNLITVSGTTASAPISISTGGQYSINGGPFTSTAGVVSPGAQVQVELTAASGFSTTDATTLTIGGVSSTFTVTTGAQPALQGSFTPVTGAVPSSVQVSNTITVTGTIAAAPISVSAGSEYSINGGAFTGAAGTVQPGATVAVEQTASAAYNTTTSTVLNVGGVTSTFNVTTATQPTVQGGFTPVTGAGVGSLQISNPITFTGTVAAPISVSSGAEYSINGGPFTSTPGTVQPGDQVRVEQTASAAYSTTTQAVLTTGGVNTTFSVTTGAQPVLQGANTAVTTPTLSSAQISSPITVSGITSPAMISISGGGEYSINGGPFTSAAGTVQAGDQVRIQLAAASTYDTTVTAVLTINGVQSKFSVTTGPQPLQNVVVTTGGGGAFGILTLGVLALLALVRLTGLRRAALVAPVAVAVLAALASAPARADDGAAPAPQDAGWLSHLYGGIRLGDATSSLSAAKLTRGLQADGYDVTASGASWGGFSGTLYAGYELPKGFAVELAGSYLGNAHARLSNVASGTLPQVLADAAHIGRGTGDIVSLEGRYRWNVKPRIDVDFRAGPYLWITDSNVAVGGVEQLSRTDTGPGFTLGVNPRYALGDHFGVGVAADYFQSTSSSHFLRFALTLEYHVR